MDARENRFLESFSPAGRERLLGRLIYHELVPGEYLFHEGDPAGEICLVLEGQVEVLETNGDHEQVFASVQPGDYLGEIAVIDGHEYSATARADGNVSIAKIPSDVLLDVLDREPVTLTLQLFQNVLSHLRKTNDLVIQEQVRREKLSLVGEMANSLLRDLRAPIQVVLSAADAIRMNHSDAETVDCCQKMENQCDRLVAMAGELLEFSRGETKLHLRLTDTSALVEQFLASNEDSFRTTGIKFSFEDQPADIEVDSLRLQRVLQNLVSNAIDAVNAKPDGRIDVRAWVADATLYLSVRDNGPGIPNEIKDRLFDPFVIYGKKGGSGLGLAIANNVVVAHRGKITFETQAGQGTEFLIRIPQDAASRAVE
jgi:signal transduction histidine kinase